MRRMMICDTRGASSNVAKTISTSSSARMNDAPCYISAFFAWMSTNENLNKKRDQRLKPFLAITESFPFQRARVHSQDNPVLAVLILVVALEFLGFSSNRSFTLSRTNCKADKLLRFIHSLIFCLLQLYHV